MTKVAVRGAIAVLGALGVAAASLVSVDVDRSESSADATAPLDPAPLGDDDAMRPLAFEPNVGQVGNTTDFVARGRGYAVSLDPTEVRVALGGSGSEVEPAALRLSLVGGSPTAVTSGQDVLPGRVNHFVGDASRWRRNVPTYGRVTAAGVYPGVDMAWYGSERGELEYDFVLAPGADAGAVRLEIGGVDSLAVDDKGDLVASTPAGPLVQRRPVAYQPTADRRLPVAAEYVLNGPNEIGFHLGRHDPALPLVIDPVIAYSGYLGGSGDDSGYEIEADAAGGTYLAGHTSSPDFPAGPGLDTSLASTSDAFVTKLDRSGAVVWSTYLGGNGREGANDIAVNGSGAAYLTGATSSSDFPVTAGLDTTLAGPGDAFITKLGPSGELSWSTYLGGTAPPSHAGISEERGNSIEVGASGDVYVGGYTDNNGLSPSPGLQVNRGGLEIFVTRMGGESGNPIWLTHLGGVFHDFGTHVAVDGTGSVFIVGSTASFDFPAIGGFDSAKNGEDAFAAKLSPAGALVWSTFIGGSGSEYGGAVVTDGAGAVYAAGLTYSQDFPATPGLDTTAAGGDIFLMKLSDGGAYSWATYVGGTGSDYDNDLATDPWGNVYLVGETTSSDFPTSAGADTTKSGSNDGFVTRFTAFGRVAWSTYLGGSGGDQVIGVDVDGTGDVYLTGDTRSADFPTTPGLDSTYGGGSSPGDAFVTKLEADHAGTPWDFDGDGDTDVAVFRSSTSTWYVSGGPTAQFGANGDVPVPGDYDVDGDTDIAVFRPSNGTWHVQGVPAVAFGTSGDIPVPGDYDGDGDTGIAVFRPSTGVWYVEGGPALPFGTSGDIPVPGDYDGDGDTDIAVFRPSNGVWYVNGGATAPFGTAGDIPVPGDYDGDGDTDLAVFRPSNGVWYVNGGAVTPFGTSGDIPVPGDYDGDGDTDLAVFRPSNGVWYVAAGPVTPFGTSGDVPVPLPSAIRGFFFP